MESIKVGVLINVKFDVFNPIGVVHLLTQFPTCFLTPLLSFTWRTNLDTKSGTCFYQSPVYMELLSSSGRETWEYLIMIKYDIVKRSRRTCRGLIPSSSTLFYRE